MNHSGSPSQTALTAAAARAAHLIVDGKPVIFADTLAEKLLGARSDELISYHRNHGEHPILADARTQVAIRSRFAEERVQRSHATQYVILGAGLDSYAYRQTEPERTVFEVDHPATQTWKQQQLADAGIDVPHTVRFVPVDFEIDDPAAALAAAGFDQHRPAIVSWLGVAMYLSVSAIRNTLALISSFAPGSELILDYILPPDRRDARGRLYADQVGAMAAAQGEPWLSTFSPEQLTTLLAEHGLQVVEHAGPRQAIPASYWDRDDALRPSALAALAYARTNSVPR